MNSLWWHIQIFLARHSQRLDLYFARKFHRDYSRRINHLIETIDLDTSDIRIEPARNAGNTNPPTIET